MRGYSCFSGYLFKYLLLCHLYLFRGESEGGWDSPIYLRPPPFPPFQRPALWESPDTATGFSWASLERSGSLRYDIQKENLENGSFWSLQPSSGRAPAAARARFSVSARISLWTPFGINFGAQKGTLCPMMLALEAPMAQFGPLLEHKFSH